NTYWALYTADCYVWCYSERMDWWNKKQVPEGCEAAIRNARANVNSGKPLGVSLEAIVADAQKRRTQAQQANRYPRMSRRTADIARAPAGSAPVIDGNLNEPFWENITPLPPFVLVGASDKPANAQTAARVSFDDKAIYIAFLCEEPNAGQLRSEKLTPNDMGIFKGNVVEVLINATRSDSMFYHFAINSSGSFWSAHHLKGKL